MRYGLYLLAMVTIIASCAQPDQPATVTVNLANAKAKAIYIIKNDFRKKIEVTDGVASDTMMLPMSGEYDVRIGREMASIYLDHGATVDLSADESDWETTLKIVNESAPNEQAYLQDKMNIGMKMFGRGIYDLEPEAYESKLKEGQEALLSALANSGASDKYASIEKDNITYNTKRMMYIYPTYADKDKETLPASFQDPLAGIDIRDEAKYKSSAEYASLVDDQFTMIAYQDTTDQYEENLMARLAKIPAGNIKNNLVNDNLYYMIGPNDKLENMYKFFMDNNSNEKHREKITEQYTAFQKLKKGEISPKFDYENHKGGSTKLDDLKGKYVYIDVWATWCGPCIGEIPSLQKVEKQYHDKDIEFVSISIDNRSDYDKWRKMVTDKELGGQQLIAENAWQSQFAQDYKINGIPRFILVDPEGKIVSADAPRPSDDKLVEKFEELGI